jgi:site-specific DNA-methyltransferase (cytosine-N4-specific)
MVERPMPKPKPTAKPKPTEYKVPRKKAAPEGKVIPIHPFDRGEEAVIREAPPLKERPEGADKPREYRATQYGKIFLGDSLDLMRSRVADSSVDLIMTSPPFGLVRKKDYGNVDAHDYVEWFKQFGREFHRVLKDSGSLVIDIGGAWISGQPTRSLYHYELLLMLCKELGFHLAQEFFWWNPARLPTPAEWVTVRRIRVKDAINCVWWLSKTPWPKASNRRVLVPYSPAMQTLLKVGYKAQLRPSGHDISEKFNTDNGAAIPPNLLAIAHTESNSEYMRYCASNGIKAHPARFPVDLPEYFVRMLTDEGDFVIDPFGGSCVTGEACEKLGRSWVCCELVEDYLKGAVGRFQQETLFPVTKTKAAPSYNISHPAALWSNDEGPLLPLDGGKTRNLKK